MTIRAPRRRGAVAGAYVHARARRPADVYLGRGSGLGNPFPLGRPCARCGAVHAGKGSTLPCYEADLRERLGASAEFRARAVAAYDRVAAGARASCFCGAGPAVPAHCHVAVFLRVVGAALTVAELPR